MKYIYETKLGYFLALTILCNIMALPFVSIGLNIYKWVVISNTFTNILVTLKRDTERWY